MPQPQPIKIKKARLARGKPLRVLDLFAGCGGLSLGFHTAGFELVAAVENDPLAARSHATAFFHGHSKDRFEEHAQARDITATEPSALLKELSVRPNPENAVDIIVGGPPCQAYARVGRAKLREVADNPSAFLTDPRSNLYLRYLQYVEELQPLAILMENVPDVMNFGGHNIADEICEVLTEEMDYKCGYTLLNSAFYGVPQLRQRMFLIAYHQTLKIPVTFPNPTHWIELPNGYSGSRAVAETTLRQVNNDQLHSFDEDDCFYQSPPEPTRNLPRAVTTKQAVRDLPEINSHLEGKMRRGARRFDTLVKYQAVNPPKFAALMRHWTGFEASEGVYDHVIRSLPRDYAIFRRMAPGDQYPEAHQHALALCEERRVARNIKKDTPEHEELISQTVPPYDPSKFPNKWRKLESNQPSRTLTAHIGKDTYSHIHYDSDQARTISVREAARLQSFPDGFEFRGTMNPAFRQIGNAVPPMLAYHLASTMSSALRITPKPLIPNTVRS